MWLQSPRQQPMIAIQRIEYKASLLSGVAQSRYNASDSLGATSRYREILLALCLLLVWCCGEDCEVYITLGKSRHVEDGYSEK